MPLRETLSGYWRTIQGELFPWLEEELGPLSERHKHLVTALEVARVEVFLGHWHGVPGRPPSDRSALARAFVAKVVFNIATTNMLIERLLVDKSLRRLCGCARVGAVPSEATFSRAFAEFARSAPAERVHAALIEKTHEDRLVGHISRERAALEARERTVRQRTPETPKRKRGRPRPRETRARPCALFPWLASPATRARSRAASANWPPKRAGAGSSATAWPRMSVTTSAAPARNHAAKNRKTPKPPPNHRHRHKYPASAPAVLQEAQYTIFPTHRG